MQGLVVRTTGSGYAVLSGGREYDCRIKGNFRIKGIKSTNPVAVGDVVEFDFRDDAGLISSILPRRNYIVRRPANLSKQLHIIAANLDQAMLVVTISHPQTSLVFVDRFLATCEAYSVPGVIVINKADLLDDWERDYASSLASLYTGIGYRCHQVSALTGQGIDDLRGAMQGKVSLLSGNSGVGKSSLVNVLVPGVGARTGALSQVHDAGMHTTTFSEMFALGGSSFIVDTPGIRGFGTIDFKREEVGHYFPEIFRTSQGCRFGNCTHTHEPGCAVLRALEQHFISQSRYDSYLSILCDEDEAKYR